MIDRVFLDFSATKLKRFSVVIESCVKRLSDDQVWLRGHATENSVGNLCLHLAGNVRQWIISGVGGEHDARDRAAEFAATGDVSSADLITRLSETVDSACAVISGLPAGRLEEKVTIQGYDQTVLEAIYHVVEHFSGHTGQVIFATKALLGEDLGFYRHLKARTHNETTP